MDSIYHYMAASFSAVASRKMSFPKCWISRSALANAMTLMISGCAGLESIRRFGPESPNQGRTSLAVPPPVRNGVPVGNAFPATATMALPQSVGCSRRPGTLPTVSLPRRMPRMVTSSVPARIRHAPASCVALSPCR